MTILLGSVVSIAIAVAVGIVILALLPLLICPRHVHMERSISIDAPIETIFQHVATTRHWLYWSPWFKRDPNIQVEFNNVPQGKGARYQWKGNKKVGQGSMEIVDDAPPHRVRLALSFVGQGDAEADFQMQQDGHSVEVTWGFDSDMGFSPMGRIFGFFMDRLLGPDYEEGLQGLKSISENGIPSPANEGGEPNGSGD